ncbi:DUF4058 family protein [bacterium]|nr:DUF4058 family protein [bacterium]
MPILDHLSEEIDDILGFQSFHNAWAVEIAYALNRVLPKGYRALSHAQIGSREVDVRTDKSLTADEKELMMCYQPADQPVTANAVFPTELEVFVLNLRHRRYKTVGVIEIVSVGNKDRPESRNSFIAKCNYLLSQEVSVIIIDLLAFPFFNLHNQLLETLKVTEGRIKKVEETPLYCASYCKTFNVKDEPAVKFWVYTLKVGNTLPRLPLFIAPEVSVPVNLEETYMNVCDGLKVFEG